MREERQSLRVQESLIGDKRSEGALRTAALS
jgi:hypothetical protein